MSVRMNQAVRCIPLGWQVKGWVMALDLLVLWDVARKEIHRLEQWENLPWRCPECVVFAARSPRVCPVCGVRLVDGWGPVLEALDTRRAKKGE
jgi:hypothetical protein